MQQSLENTPRKLSMLLQDLVEIPGGQDCEIRGLALDSRQAGEGDLFFACAGTITHGVQYLQQVLDAGVAAVVWEPTPEVVSVPGAEESGVPVIPVQELGQLMGVIADRFYDHPSRDLMVVGVTGTDGKTSCSQFLGNSLDAPEHRCGIIGTLGYGLFGELHEASHTTPDALRMHRLLYEMREQNARYAIMEVSSHALDQGRVNGVSFDIALLTNLTRDHLDYHGDEKAYALAKRRLFELPGVKHAVLNHDDDFGRQLISELEGRLDLVSYGFGDFSREKSLVQIRGSALSLESHGMSFTVNTPWGDSQVTSELLGRFNASNLLAVLSVLLLLEVPLDEACTRIEKLATVAGRMEHFEAEEGSGKPTVVVDYAHTADALGHVLQALREHCKGQLWCVFGCGGDRDRGKRPLMGAMAERFADHVILTDDNPRHEDPKQIIYEILSGIANNEAVQVIGDRAAAILQAIQSAGEEDVVLVAGKGHEEYQIIGEKKHPFSDRDLVKTLLQGGAR